MAIQLRPLQTGDLVQVTCLIVKFNDGTWGFHSGTSKLVELDPQNGSHLWEVASSEFFSTGDNVGKRYYRP